MQAEPVYKLAIFFYAMASLAECVLWIYLFITRFSHAGRVCSGDYLSNRQAPIGYCMVQGRFIYIVALLVGAAFCCTIFIVPFVAGRKRRRARSVALS